MVDETNIYDNTLVESAEPVYNEVSATDESSEPVYYYAVPAVKSDINPTEPIYINDIPDIDEPEYLVMQ